MPFLIDATVVSNFAAAERLDLVRRALGAIDMAVTVYAEVQRGIAEGYEFLCAIDACIVPPNPDGWVRIIDLDTDEEREHFNRLLTVVQPGEAASLALAAHRGLTFATDDRPARLLAAHGGIEVTGTLGILLDLVEKGVLALDEANELLNLMIVRARYRSPVSDLRALLDGAEPE